MKRIIYKKDLAHGSYKSQNRRKGKKAQNKQLVGSESRNKFRLYMKRETKMENRTRILQSNTDR